MHGIEHFFFGEGRQRIHRRRHTHMQHVSSNFVEDVQYLHDNVTRGPLHQRPAHPNVSSQQYSAHGARREDLSILWGGRQIQPVDTRDEARRRDHSTGTKGAREEGERALLGESLPLVPRADPGLAFAAGFGDAERGRLEILPDGERDDSFGSTLGPLAFTLATALDRAVSSGGDPVDCRSVIATCSS